MKSKLLKIFLLTNLFVLFNFIKVCSKFEFLGKDACLELVGDSSRLILNSDIKNFGGILKIPSKDISAHIKNLDQHKIYFEKGSLLFGDDNNAQTITCSFSNFANTRDITETSILMTGNQVLNFSNSQVMQSIQVSGLSNLLSGTPLFTQKIILEDLTSELLLNLNNKLSQNVVLNGGTITLLNDLQLKDNTSFEGTGNININNHRLSFPSNCPNPPQHNLIFSNANDIQLSGYTYLDGTWTFSGENSYSTINGYGNILDITAGGNITVGPNHTLYITGVTIKGLGVGFGSIILDQTAEVKLTSSTITLSDNFVLPSGTITIISADCKMIIKDKHYFVVTGPNGTLKVDGVIFKYETIGNAPIYPPPFGVYPGGNISLVNSGNIISSNFQSMTGEIQFSIPEPEGINYVTGNVAMNQRTKIHFINENPLNYKPMILDCMGKTASYSQAETSSVIIDENISLTIRNLIADNLSFEKLSLLGSGDTKSKINYGDNVTHILGKDFSITDIPLNIVGNVDIKGNNHMINTTGPRNIIVSEGKTLSIFDSTLNLTCSDSIVLLGDNSKIYFNNVLVNVSSNGWIIDRGNIECQGYVEVATIKKHSENCYLNFLTNGNWNVLQKSKLFFSEGIELLYSPTKTSTLESNESLKRHFNLFDNSSVLNLSNCTFEIGSSGLAFDQGSILINNNVRFEISDTPLASLDLGDDLQVTINPGANMYVTGCVNYGSE